MAYLVKITARAQQDLTVIYMRKEAEHSQTARKWYLGLREAILSLEEQPHRCSKTPENEKLRQLLYGTKPHFYRIIFRILEKANVVEVLHIRHGARKRFAPIDTQ